MLQIATVVGVPGYRRQSGDQAVFGCPRVSLRVLPVVDGCTALKICTTGGLEDVGLGLRYNF